MNNTLSYTGLSYSHSAYAPHQNAGEHIHGSNAPLSSVHNRTPYSPQQFPPAIPPSGNGMPHQYYSPNSDNHRPSMYPPSSLGINPYMQVESLPLSVYPAAPHHSHPQYITPPPPGFNSCTTAYQHNMIPSSSHDHLRTRNDHHSYASYNPSNSVVPYSGSSQRYAGYSSMQPSYRFPQQGPQYQSVDSVLIENLRDVHFSYLNTDDSPEKLELWKKMDELIQIFVSITKDDQKYSFPGIREILSISIQEKGANFDGFKAGEAFEALAIYAANLIIHPWRKEYRTMKLYSGYWVHKVSKYLSSAEKILKLMGYVPVNNGDDKASAITSYQLPNSIIGIDGDSVARLALDCHIACSECQILGKLHQEFSQLNYSRLLQYRRLISGSYEDTALSLFNFLNSKYPALTQHSNDNNAKQKSTNSNSSYNKDEIDGSFQHSTKKSKELVKHSSNKKSLVDEEMRRNADKLMMMPSSSSLKKSYSNRQKNGSYRYEDSKTSPSSSNHEYRNTLPILPTHSSLLESSNNVKQLITRDHSRDKNLEKYSNCSSVSSEGNYKRKQLQYQPQHESTVELRRKPEERIIPVSLEERDVATAKLIDHSIEESIKQPPSMLPKVLPQYHRSSKSSQPQDKSSQSFLSDYGGQIPNDRLYNLPNNIPSDMFQNKQMSEHITESFNQVREKKKSESNSENYRDSWGFVFHDLEKKGYNKDVGNRGDILNTLTGSKVSTNNNLTDKKTTTLLSTTNKGELLPDCIPSTVQTTGKQSKYEVGFKGPFDIIADTVDQLDLVGKEASGGSRKKRVANTGAGRVSGTSSVTLNKEDRRSNSSVNRKSIYDNVSYGGFETACQDSDDEEDDLNDKQFQTTREDLQSKYVPNLAPSSSSTSTKLKKSEGNSAPSRTMPWNCSSCTFSNETHPTVCEMCSKSRSTPDNAPIKPLVTGSLQCPQCTLFNEKDRTECSACNCSLEACATYI